MRKFIAGLTALIVATAAPAQRPLPPPHLIVAISIDQFSADLFDQYRSQFTGGMARLASGTVFRNGYQGQAETETCPGHSTILTGDLPAHTGIISNEWIDPAAPRPDKRVYCAEDERAPGSSSDHYTVSSVNLRVPTLGDLLKQHSPASLNVAVSGKDRAAVMMSGHDVDQRWYWSGKGFVTDLTGKPVPASVAATNAAIAALVARPEPPLVPTPFCQARATPIPLPGGGSVGNGTFARAAGDYAAFHDSPALDAATLALAARLVQELKLGQHASPDLLSVGLSATDYVGHAYGPGGQEMCLNLLSLDRDLAGFFAVLDAAHLDYAVVLTADHGSMDMPERLHATQPLAQRADPELAASSVGKAIGAKLGLPGQVLIGGVSGNIYVDPAVPPAKRSQVLAQALDFYRAQPQVAAVFTKAELEREPVPTGDPVGWSLLQRARASFDAQRSGDLVVLLKQWVMPLTKARVGLVSTHGTPWDYDRRVPILFWRSGMAPADRTEAIDTTDIMPTLAAMIRLPIDASAIDGHCLTDVQDVTCPAR